MRLGVFFIVLFIFYFHSFNSLAQNNPRKFKVYIAMNGLNSQDKKNISDRGIEFVRLFSGGMLDIDDNQVIEKKTIKRNIRRFFPKKDAKGILVIDWEEELWKDLKKKPSNTEAFTNAFNQYRDAIKYIRELRPNLQIGIYGLPFRAFWNRGEKWKERCNKITPLLSYCDFIAPSLYMLYTNKRVGKKRNMAYLEGNLKMALKLGMQLNKPVLPFVWHKWHPSNEDKALSFLDEDEFIRYIKLIKSYEYQESQVAGIIWWDNPNMGLKNDSESQILSNFRSISDYKRYESEVLIKYLDGILAH